MVTGEWTRRLAVELLRQSPEPSLRACALAGVYPPLAAALQRSLSCWGALGREGAQQPRRVLGAALDADGLSPELLRVMLNLFGSWSDEKPLPIEAQLGDLAERCQLTRRSTTERPSSTCRISRRSPRDGAAARRCRRRRCRRRSGRRGRRRRRRRCRAAARRAAAAAAAATPTAGRPGGGGGGGGDAIDSLISINNQLGLPDAAAGIPAHYRARPGAQIREEWYSGWAGGATRATRTSYDRRRIRARFTGRSAPMRARARRVEGPVGAGGRGVGSAVFGTRLDARAEVARWAPPVRGTCGRDGGVCRCDG